MDVMNYKGIEDSPGTLMSIEQLMGTDVRTGEKGPIVVRFILTAIPDNEGNMYGVITDLEYNRINSNDFVYRNINEFLVLKAYLVRNGITVG